jgi:hypothetical protein
MEKPTKDSSSESLKEKIERNTGVKIRFYRWTVEHQLTATSILQVTLPAVDVYNAIPLPEVLDTLNQVTPK